MVFFYSRLKYVGSKVGYRSCGIARKARTAAANYLYAVCR